MRPSILRNNPKYQWVIVVAVLICSIIWSGLGFFVFSIFVKPLQSEFGWDRSTIMSGFMFWSMTVGGASILVGKAVDKYRPGAVIFVGSIITGIGFLSLSYIETPLHFYLGYIIVGIGNAAIGQVPSTALVSEWFNKKRGFALGIMSTGIGLGGLIISPLASGVLIPLLGWRKAYQSLGMLACIVIVPLTLFVIRSKDMHLNDRKDAGGNLERGSVTSEKDSGIIDVTLKKTLASSLIWLVAASYLLSQFASTGTLQSLVPHLNDIGFSATISASILGMVGLVSSVSKLFFGWLCDLIRAKYAFILGVFFQTLGTLVLLQVTPSSHTPILWFFAFIMGMGSGSWLPAMSISISRNFSSKTYGTLFGLVNFALSIGLATGPLFAGVISDMTGSYHWAFIVFIGFYVLSILTALLGQATEGAYAK